MKSKRPNKRQADKRKEIISKLRTIALEAESLGKFDKALRVWEALAEHKGLVQNKRTDADLEKLLREFEQEVRQ